LNDEKHSDELSEKYLKPYTYERSEPYAPLGERVTAYLCIMDRRVHVCGKAKGSSPGAEAKASLKVAILVACVRPETP
jgi:hypothetical protein